MVSSSDTGSFAEGQTVAQQGSFSKIPDPKVWSNGDDVYAGVLNQEWRDAFKWLLRSTTPAFSGHNADGAALSYTVNAAVPIKVEDLKRGNLTHAANDSKVYVWEPGWYLAHAGFGVVPSGTTGTNFSSTLRVNGVLQSAGDINRVAGGLVGAEHLVSLTLNAGDYVEIALGGQWSGTAPTAGTSSSGYPWLHLWWRRTN